MFELTLLSLSQQEVVPRWSREEETSQYSQTLRRLVNPLATEKFCPQRIHFHPLNEQVFSYMYVHLSHCVRFSKAKLGGASAHKEPFQRTTTANDIHQPRKPLNWRPNLEISPIVYWYGFLKLGVIPNIGTGHKQCLSFLVAVTEVL